MPITRRSLLAAASALPFASLAFPATFDKVLRPKALVKGDLVALVAPSSAIDDQGSIDLAKRNVEALGFRSRLGAHALDHWGYLGGTDEHRAADLNAAFEDPEVRGIVCLIGGYGAGRILDRLDYDTARRDPKVLVGYSDVTALLLALYARAGIVTFHGPVAISRLDGYEIGNLLTAIETPEPIGLLSPPSKPEGMIPQPGPTTLRTGKAKGPLVGGNLSLVSSLVGSPYLPKFDGHIVFLEDIGEDPYRIDRMLNTLRISGSLKGLHGLVFGDFSPRADKPAPKPPPDPTRDFTMLQVLQNFADQMQVPAYCGAWIGHIRDKYTLPLGIPAALDADNKTLTILETAVSAPKEADNTGRR